MKGSNVVLYKMDPETLKNQQKKTPKSIWYNP